MVKDGKSDKNKNKKKKDETNDEDLEDDNQNNEPFGSKNFELKELDLTQYHNCHYDGCEKRFPASQELQYHISNAHKKRVVCLILMYPVLYFSYFSDGLRVDMYSNRHLITENHRR